MTPMIIDCDPGHDDAMALLYAAKTVDLIGITTVFGNTTVEQTTRNALSICRLAGLDVPVAKGMSKPLVTPVPPVVTADMHGANGIAGADLPEPDRDPVAEHAVTFIIEQARRHRGELVLAGIGALTNIAMALKLEPRLVDWLAGITVMGGSTTIGNITPLAEYNIYCDPEAASVVFNCGLPIVMAGLNVTRQAGVGDRHVERLRATGGPVGKAFGDLMQFYLTRSREVFNLSAASMHDPCAIIPYVEPSLMTLQDAHVHIELASPQLRGMTACDLRKVNSRNTSVIEGNAAPNAKVAVAIEGDAAVDHVIEIIAGYDA